MVSDFIFRIDLSFYSSYLTHLSAPLNQWLNNLIFFYNQPPFLSNVVTNNEILRYFCGICEQNKSSVVLLSTMCCIGGILNKGHISILTPVPTTALDLKTFAGSYLPLDGSKHLEILRLFVLTSHWFCLEISFLFLQCFWFIGMDIILSFFFKFQSDRRKQGWFVYWK